MDKKDEALCKNAVRSAIRKTFSRSAIYKDFLESKKIEWYAGKRRRVSYMCNHCKAKYSKKDIQVDHIVPIGHGVYNSLKDAYRYSVLVFCDASNLQVLCKPCHKLKTAEERANPSFHNVLF